MTSRPTTPSRGTGEPASVRTPQTGEPRETERLRENIAATRAELADTVEALAAKGDLKARAKDKVVGVKAAAGEQAGHAAQTTKVTAARVGRQAHGKITHATAKAKKTKDSLQAAPMARRSGAAAAAVGVAVAGGAALVWMRRRQQARRHLSPWQQAMRMISEQIMSMRAQARAQAEVARRQVERQAQAQLAAARIKAKMAKVARAKAKAKAMR